MVHKHLRYVVTDDKPGPGAMDKEPNAKHIKESFVARIWLEQGDNRDATWRGHIRHVQGTEEEYFQSLKEMSEFLARVSGVSGPALTVQPLGDSMNSKPGTVTNIKNKN